MAEDKNIIDTAKKVSEEVNMLNTELLGIVQPIDMVAKNIEEVVILQEFRAYRNNFRIERIKSLKHRFMKIFN